jgi:hypothetical protein
VAYGKGPEFKPQYCKKKKGKGILKWSLKQGVLQNTASNVNIEWE